MRVTRRRLMQGAASAAALAWLPRSLAAEAGSPASGAPETFRFDRLIERARRLAQRPYQPTPSVRPELLERIDYDAYQKIGYRDEHALWAGDRNRLPVEFFHLGKYFKQPVEMSVVRDGMARRIPYSPELFDYGDLDLADELPDDLGFAGFRVLNPPGRRGDWLAFLGASYFRSSGALNQYGQSARGIAVNTQIPGATEEFPRFTAFWLEQPVDDAHRLTVYALMEGASLTGAYRFECSLAETVRTDVHAELFCATTCNN